MAVKFLKTTQVGTLYNEGEIASFDSKAEAELIAAKVAEAHKVKEVAPESTPTPTPPPAPKS